MHVLQPQNYRCYVRRSNLVPRLAVLADGGSRWREFNLTLPNVECERDAAGDQQAQRPERISDDHTNQYAPFCARLIRLYRGARSNKQEGVVHIRRFGSDIFP